MGESSAAAVTVISVALMLFLGFLMTRITKRLRLPNVTAYIVVGILMGPYCLNLIPQKFIQGSEFLADIALAFISFSVGEFLRVSTLKKSGIKSVIITLMETCMASLLVFLVTNFVLHLSMTYCIVLSALASATASTSTLMTIRQTGSRGEFVDTLLQVVALDNLVALLAYSVAISVTTEGGGGSFLDLAAPILKNLLILVLGGGFGFLLKLLMPKSRTTDNRLIISVSVLFFFCGICTLLDVSPLLGCMAMGMVYANINKEDKLFKQLNYFSPPLLLLFFVRSGLNFNLSALTGGSGVDGGVSLLTIGIVYALVRVVGKYSGAFLGCWMVKKPKEVRNYLGLALIPQAGVAIGLATLCVRALGPDVGGSLQTVILASSILYELVGPACAKVSLYLSKSYSNDLEQITEVSEKNADGTQKTQAQILIERIRQIQETLPEHTSLEYEAEQAFLQAAEETNEAYEAYAHQSHFLNRNRRR